jgi:hypothetical protein
VAGQLTLRLQRGDVVVELQGDSDAVQAAFVDLKANGLGVLAPLFALGAPPARTGPSSDAPGPASALTNPAASFRFVFESMSLPTAAQLFASDVNGDGRPDNAFANIINALNSQSLDLQGEIDAELKNGQLIVLLSLATEFATPAPDQRATVTLLAGIPVKPSEHVYIVDASVPPLALVGRIVAGRFVSDDPHVAGSVPNRDIRIPFGPGASAVLPVHGLGLAFDVRGDGSAISNGQLTGSVRQVDVQSQLVPALAAGMTHLIQNAPASPTAQTIQQLFDKGACTNPNGTVAQAGDGVIDVCELLTSPLVMALLQPDVQIWDANGNYAPNPLGGNPDSMSIGLGFSAIAASY